MSFLCGKCGKDMSTEEVVEHPIDCIITQEVKYAASLYVTGGDTFLISHQAEYEAFLAGYEYAYRGDKLLGIK